jgi:hypothetical protein
VPETQWNGVRELREQVQQHDKDLYRGNGQPGLTTRMAQAEGRITNVEKVQASIDAKFWAIILMLLVTLAGLAVDIAVHK